jgi:hypothetical protein
MNSNAFFNRIEILLYSTLISAMSGINHLRAHIQHSTETPTLPSPAMDAEPSQINREIKVRSLSMSWNSFKEVLLTLLLWVILGFASGFLIGMINPR